MRRLEIAGLVPHWNFFAPTPATSDFYLLYRDMLEDRSLTEWRELFAKKRRPIWACVWNPGRRQNKALFDGCNSLMREAASERQEVVMLTLSYLLLLNSVSSAPHHEVTIATQFMIMVSPATIERRKFSPAFVSRFHRLEAPRHAAGVHPYS